MRFTSRFSSFSFAALCIVVSLPIANAQHAPKPDTHGIITANMDRSVMPGDNFYLYANGDWIKRTVIPPDRAGVDVFTNLLNVSNQRTNDLIKDAAKENPPAGSNGRKIADLYQSFMNEKAIEAEGLRPLRPHLAAIEAIHNKRDLAYALGKSLRADVDPLNNTNFHTSNLFGMWVAPGFHDSEHYIPYFLEGGLTMPDREYYVDDSAAMKKIRA